MAEARSGARDPLSLQTALGLHSAQVDAGLFFGCGINPTL